MYELTNAVVYCSEQIDVHLSRPATRCLSHNSLKQFHLLAFRKDDLLQTHIRIKIQHY